MNNSSNNITVVLRLDADSIAYWKIKSLVLLVYLPIFPAHCNGLRTWVLVYNGNLQSIWPESNLEQGTCSLPTLPGAVQPEASTTFYKQNDNLRTGMIGVTPKSLQLRCRTVAQWSNWNRTQLFFSSFLFWKTSMGRVDLHVRPPVPMGALGRLG